MQVLTTVDQPRIAALRERDEFFWLDLTAPPEPDLQLLGRMLRLHPIAIEDTLEFGQRPKVDRYEDHVLIVVFTASMGTQPVTLEVHLYVSGGFVVTVHRAACTPLADLHERFAGEPSAHEDYLVYLILDSLTDAYYPVVEELGRRTDDLEDRVLQRARREQLGEIYRLRQDMRGLSRVVGAQRDQFPAAIEAIRGLAGLTRGKHEYLRDVGDHLAQVAGELQRRGDDLVALTTTYFNANTDRLNATATRLTVIGTLFVVSTLVTGFFGQNFGWLVENIDTMGDFLMFGVGGLAVPIAVLLALFWFKRREWF